MEREIEFKKKNLNFQQNRGKNRDFIGIKVKSHRPLISNNSISKLDKGSDETNTNSDTNRRKEQRDTNNTKRRKETDFRDKIALGECVSINQSSKRKGISRGNAFARSIGGNEFRGELLHPGVRGLAYRFVIRDYSIRKAGGERSGEEMWVISCNLLPGREESVSKTRSRFHSTSGNP